MSSLVSSDDRRVMTVVSQLSSVGSTTPAAEASRSRPVSTISPRRSISPSVKCEEFRTRFQVGGNGLVAVGPETQWKSTFRDQILGPGPRDDKWLQMAGIGQNDLPGFTVSDSHQDRREVLVTTDIELVGAHLQYNLGQMPLQEVGPDGESKAGHDRCGADSLSGDIADDKAEAVVVDCDQAVPISTDVDAVGSRDLPRGPFQIGKNGKLLRQKGSLKCLGDCALLSIETVEAVVEGADRCRELFRVSSPPDELLGLVQQTLQAALWNRTSWPSESYECECSRRTRWRLEAQRLNVCSGRHDRSWRDTPSVP